MSRPRGMRVITGGPPTARQAERSLDGWQWTDAAGGLFSLEWHRKRRVWIARWAPPGRAQQTTDGPSVAAATAGWPVLARATFRRTLRPLGIL